MAAKRRSSPDKNRRRPRPGEFEATSCDCAACRAACLNAPGWFAPDQVPRLARHLGLGVEETFRRHLAVGVTRMPDGTNRSGVLPHKLRDGKKPGSRWTLSEIARPGRCIFYDRGRCAIHPVRPRECALMMHDRADHSVAIRHGIVLLWTREALAPYLAWSRTSAPKGTGRA
jgi:Fe-S-cluster containining protein